MRITEKLIKTTESENLKMISIYLLDQLTDNLKGMRNYDIEIFRYKNTTRSLEKRLSILWDRMEREGIETPTIKNDCDTWNFGEIYAYC